MLKFHLFIEPKIKFAYDKSKYLTMYYSCFKTELVENSLIIMRRYMIY